MTKQNAKGKSSSGPAKTDDPKLTPPAAGEETTQDTTQQTAPAATPSPLEQLVNDLGEMPGLGSIARKAAEVQYYEMCDGKFKFEDLDIDKQRHYIGESKRFLDRLDKLNLMVVPKRDLRAERLRDKGLITRVVTSFLEKMNKPKDLHKVIPIEELVERILEGRVT